MSGSFDNEIRHAHGGDAAGAREHFLVCIVEQGSAVVTQDGRTAHLGANEFAVCDGVREYTIQLCGGHEAVLLKLHRPHLVPMLSEPEMVTATKVGAEVAAAHLLIAAARGLCQHIDVIEPRASLAVSAGLASLLAGALQSVRMRRDHALSSLAVYHLNRIKEVIDERLRDQKLSVSCIANEAGLSERQVQRLFRQNEGLAPARYFWNRRLENCSRDLLDARHAKRSVADIAFSWGFATSAHFSRAFRARFGCTPREWRRLSIAAPQED